MQRLRRRQSGQGLIEYAFLLGLVGMVVLLAVHILGTQTTASHCRVSRNLGGIATEGSSCEVVYGQGGSFTANGPNTNGISAASADNPRGVLTDGAGGFYMADTVNNRVLYFAAGSSTASRVYGQGGSFATNNQNNGGFSANSLYSPMGMALDGSGGLYVADEANNRVLYYASGSTTATRVYGQNGAFNTVVPNNPTVSASSLDAPWSLAVDASGGLYISDQSNHRVLYFTSGSTVASRVYGQGGSFSTNSSNNGGVSANSLSYPAGIALDSAGNLYVADSGNNRVLFFPSGSTTATKVYGQSGSFATSANALGATGLYDSMGPALDKNGNLAVADTYNDRVLYFAAGTGCTAANTPSGCGTATKVYGQGGNFNTQLGNQGGACSATGLAYPYAVAFDSNGNLFIADANNNRVVEIAAQ